MKVIEMWDGDIILEIGKNLNRSNVKIKKGAENILKINKIKPFKISQNRFDKN